MPREHSLPEEIFNSKTSTYTVLVIENYDVDYDDNHVFINDHPVGDLSKGDNAWVTTRLEFDPTFLKAGTNIVRIEITWSDNVTVRKSELCVYYEVFSISGTTTAGSTPIPGVTITFSFDNSTATTDNNGNYSGDVYKNTTTTITPFKSGYNWNPSARTVDPVTTNLINQNFSADTKPEVTTLLVSNITNTTATGGGNVTSAGDSPVTARGVCWNTSPDPNISNPHTNDGTGTGTFTSSITGLTPGTTYYVRAYATNSAGTAYGSDVSFVTKILPATVVTGTVSGITYTSAYCSGEVTSEGDSAVIARGGCWGTAPYPTVSPTNSTVDGQGLGGFNAALSGLTPGTFYYVRAYATNSGSTAYGDNVSFTTLSDKPVVVTGVVSAVTYTSASYSGNVTSEGISPVTARGVCWGTSQDPTIEGNKTMNGGGVGDFSGTLTGLTMNTTYYVRAYATNSIDTAYGGNVSFKTNPAALPTITTTAVTNISHTTASGGGNVTSDGGYTVTKRGICWGTSPDPTLSIINFTEDGGGTGEFSSAMTGLTMNTTYYVRAYATNGIGTAYGGNVGFSTNPAALPTVITSSVTAITATTAVGGGNVTSAGDSAVTTRGICWGTAPCPTISDNFKPDGVGIGEFSSAMIGLTSGTFYYVRAYATNSSGTAYGSNVTFTTLSNLPTVITGAVSAVTYTSASCSGNVTSEGSSLVTERGVCWSTTKNPTITSDSYTMNGGGTGEFSDSITGLSPNTTYYVRAYATNSSGTAYGGNVSFRTNPAALPAITTAAVTNVTQNTAEGGGNVTSDGGYTVTKRGICWGTSPDPTLSIINFTEDGGGTGEFSSAMTGLTPGTFYYVRAYATNGIGTGYGGNVGFSTNPAALSTVITSSVTGITGTTAVAGGNVTSEGDSPVTARGVCWGTSPYPDISTPFKTIDGGGPGQFSSALTGLLPGTLYYARAYATNGSGTSYGSNVSFTTISDLPTVVIGSVYNMTYTTASCSANVTSQGTSPVTARGVCWSTSTNPTITGNHTMDGGGTGDFYSSITGLTPGTFYYVRPYATNSSGTAYGSSLTLTTDPAALPTVTTVTVTGITDIDAIGGGNVTSAGDSPVTARGVCWSTSPYPTISINNYTIDGSGTGEFSSVIYGLTPETLYYARAYATNSSGTTYGSNVSFTTAAGAALPLVQTAAISNITTTSASCGGNVIDDGGAAVTARGVCWNTSENPTTADNHTLDGSGTGVFTSSITGLTEGVTYYLRAYATNKIGTGYGSQQVFTPGRPNPQDPPRLDVSRTHMNFTVMLAGTNVDTFTGSQRFFIVNTGGGTLEWTINPSDNWIKVSPASGIGDALVSVSINPAGLTIGENIGSLFISAPGAEDSPQTMTIYLRVAHNSEETPPEGSFDTPLQGAWVSGSIPVTGWAIDDVEVTAVTIYRDPGPGEGNDWVYIGKGVFVEGARPDVEALYAGYPNNSTAGWGYMMLTHFLPNGGNGAITLHVEAVDTAGHKTLLGSKTIYCDNANAVKPFGAIDTPTQGGMSSGTAFINWGWALTPQPNYIPADGSTLLVFIDGKNQGSPQYNLYRDDVSRLLPGYVNSNSAGGYYTIDTTAFFTGVHTIAWAVSDSAGNVDGIGSRYFIIVNPRVSGSSANTSSTFYTGIPLVPGPIPNLVESPLPVSPYLYLRSGWQEVNRRPRIMTPDSNGIFYLDIKELEPLEVFPSPGTKYTAGCMLVDGQYRPLPPGAGIDFQTGVFHWMPGPGFIGTYTFILTGITGSGTTGKEIHDHIIITINPKSKHRPEGQSKAFAGGPGGQFSRKEPPWSPKAK
jgi:hypothetical protein